MHVPSTNRILFVRPAQMADSKDLLRWRNDPLTRKMFRNNQPVSYASHSKWFSGKLAQNESYILIGILADQSKERLGVVRFDKLTRAACAFEASLNIAPEARGKGYGAVLLIEAVRYISERLQQRHACIAYVRHSNLPSIRSFERAGFTLASDGDEFIKYERQIVPKR